MAPLLQSDKPTLLFVPHYIGSFKYYEKLKPFLEDRYEVIFLLIFPHQKAFAEMKQYAEARGHASILIPPPRFFSGASVFGVFSYIAALFAYRRGVNELFKKPMGKIIAPNDSGIYIRYLFNKARRHRVETLVLQWAMAYEGARARIRKVGAWHRQIIYEILKPLYAGFKKIFARLLLGSDFTISKELTGLGNSDRMGVINRRALDYFISHGVSPEKLSIVGYLDYHFSQTVKRDLDLDSRKRVEAMKRLSIDPSLKLITLFSSPYNGKDVNVLTDAEQYDFTSRIMNTIREICPASRFALALKIHPSERIELYRPLEKIGVKIFGKDTDNYELVYFTDLYVAGGTAVNFVPLIMGKDAIFINFLKLSNIEDTRPIFNIKKFVTDDAEFRELLTRYREGILPRQYADVEDVITHDSLKKIIAWIG